VKAIQLLINQLLPVELRDYTRNYDAKVLGKLLAQVASQYPDQYPAIAKGISDLGRKATYLQGETLTLSDLRPTFDRDGVLAKMDAEVEGARKTAKSPEEFDQVRERIWVKYSDDLEKLTADSAMAAGNNLAYSVVSGARGKGAQLKAMIATPGVYTDYKDRVIPVFARRSFSEGLRPAEFFAGTFGARKSVISTKVGTAKGGDIGKQAAQVASHIVVTTKDCGTTNGIDLEPGDASLRGRVLAAPAGGLPAGTVIDRQAMRELQKVKGKILVRSALTCSAEHGMCARCAGTRMDGQLPKIGESVGVSAVQALCLAKGTLVRMANGEAKPIESIVPGDVIFGSDVSGKLRLSAVKNVWSNGSQPCIKTKYRVLNDQTVEVVSTDEHRFVFQVNKRENYVGVREGKSPPAKLQPPALISIGDARTSSHRKYAAIPSSYDDTEHAWVPDARLIGVLLGDGCISGGTGSGGLALSAYDPSMLADLKTDLDQLGLTLMQTCPGEYRLSMKVGASAEYQSTSSGERIRNCLKRILINEGVWGYKAVEKRLPSSIAKWDNESVFSLIAGLIATDGCVSRNTNTEVKGSGTSVHIASNSKRMLQEVQHLLQTRAGIRCGEISFTTKQKDNGENYDPTYKLFVTGYAALCRLRDTVGPFIPGVKRERLTRFLDEDPPTGKVRYMQARLLGWEDAGMQETFDLEIDHPDHIYLLDNLLLTHNSEPITQGALSSKHTAGQASGKKVYSGLDVITQLIQTPEIFPDKAEVAQEAGRVAKIEPAPQGGQYVHIGETRHYVHPDYPLTVKLGDQVEAGEPLSDGIIDPSDIVRLRGLGSGRRYYSQRLKQVLDDSGLAANLRNTEMLARAAIDHVVVDDADGIGEFLPDDTVSYNRIAQVYPAPESSKKTEVSERLAGQYLYSPALHYTVGTKLTPKMAKRIQDAGVKEVYVSSEAPKFYPQMVRLRAAAHSQPDWLARMSTSYIKSNLADTAARGADTDIAANHHWAPRLAVGDGFGRNTATTGKF
jgi:hypothetical protein